MSHPVNSCLPLQDDGLYWSVCVSPGQHYNKIQCLLAGTVWDL